ncbi:MAG: biotin transport system substrate-specific component [Clostridiales bacterium]|jgi:biotin transport system substrate-specific component|nr:biotin transport system substrate-specific component [Clostridiales bacterium]MDK2933797.1 biotin transport system substrate-specific component [Clostridiales bacterium]
MTLVALFAALTAVGAFIKIPIPFVPFTLQFFFCAFAGILLGARLGMLSQIVYVVVGLSGVPVFTQGGGPSYIFQPSFGYLIGFIAGAYVIGKVSERFKALNLKNALISILSGLFVIYLLGVPYLYMIYNFYLNDTKSLWWAVYWGFLTCVGGDIVLSVIVSTTACRIIPILRKTGLIKTVS